METETSDLFGDDRLVSLSPLFLGGGKRCDRGVGAELARFAPYEGPCCFNRLFGKPVHAQGQSPNAAFSPKWAMCFILEAILLCVKTLAAALQGSEYDVLRRSCHHFCAELSKLGPPVVRSDCSLDFEQFQILRAPTAGLYRVKGWSRDRRGPGMWSTFFKFPRRLGPRS